MAALIQKDFFLFSGKSDFCIYFLYDVNQGIWYLKNSILNAYLIKLKYLSWSVRIKYGFLCTYQ